jgi:hypothetical protein
MATMKIIKQTGRPERRKQENATAGALKDEQ